MTDFMKHFGWLFELVSSTCRIAKFQFYAYFIFWSLWSSFWLIFRLKMHKLFHNNLGLWSFMVFMPSRTTCMLSEFDLSSSDLFQLRQSEMMHVSTGTYLISKRASNRHLRLIKYPNMAVILQERSYNLYGKRDTTVKI